MDTLKKLRSRSSSAKRSDERDERPGIDHCEVEENYDGQEHWREALPRRSRVETGHPSQEDYDYEEIYVEPKLSTERENKIKSNILLAQLTECCKTINEVLVKQKKKPKFNIAQMIDDHSYEEERRLKTIEDDLRKKMQDQYDTHKKKELEDSMSFHTVNPAIEPPKSFNVNSGLADSHSRATLMRSLPTGNGKFSGNKGSLRISEYLMLMTKLCDLHKLSKSEFMDMLVQTSTGGAFDYITLYLKRNSDIPCLYYDLMITYDREISSTSAEQELTNLKAKKTDTLHLLLQQISKLADLASRGYVNAEIRTALIDSKSCSALITSLPEKSKMEVYREFNLLSQKLNRPPKFNEFTRVLYPIEQSIDHDIARNGFSGRDNRDQRILNVNKKNFENRSEKSVNVVGNYNNKIGKSRGNSKGEPRNSKFSGTIGCILCGMENHKASDGCRRMRDDNGKIVPISPVQRYCSTCFQEKNVKLFHPQYLCFRRDTYPRNQRANQKKKY